MTVAIKYTHAISMDRFKLTQMLHGIMIADALASPLDNLSAGHIRNVFGTIQDYTDPACALKHKLHLWKKPGLYTAISQYCVLLSVINIREHTYNHQHVVNFLFSLGDSNCIFRHPRGFLQHLNSPYDAPTAELLICIPTVFFLQKQNPLSLIHFILTHNKNAAVCVSALFIYMLLEDITRLNLQALDGAVLQHTVENVLQFTHTYSSAIFDNGGNSHTIIQAAEDLHSMIQHMPHRSSLTQYTEYCLPFAHRWSKNTYTRLTVNHPFTLVPMALYCIETNAIENVLYTAVHQGGTISLLVPLVAILATALYGYDCIPKHLMDTMVNKKRILQLLEGLQKNSISMEFISEFFQNEKNLTQKEQEELESKLKHVASKRPSSKKSQDAHKDMTQIVVESWTKLDKAKWKKERRKY